MLPIDGFHRAHSFSALIIAFFAFFQGTVSAQAERIVAHAALAEKIYLQFDADVYTTDQTIWVKAIVVESATHAPTVLSGVLHIDLIGPDEELKQRKRIKLVNGIGNTGFVLNEAYSAGKYLVRAFTEWNKNYGDDFIFQTYVDIFPTSSELRSNPITAINLVAQQRDQYRLNAQLVPELIDKEHKKELLVYLTIDGKKDTLYLKSGRNGYYLLDYPIPPGAVVATVNMATQHGKRYTRTIALRHDALDLQFFAEGGDLLHGMVNKVGFKALDSQGQGRAVSGIVMDSRGNAVSTLKSNHLGMGSFSMVADSSLSYYAVLDSLGDLDLTHRYPLPDVVGKGHAITVAHSGDSLQVTAFSNVSAKSTLFFVEVSCRGLLFYSVKGPVKDSRMEFAVPSAGLPEGVVSFKLMDSNRQPVAERLFFNQRQEARLSIQLSTDKAVFRQREKSELEITVAPRDGEVPNASLSVMVMNHGHVGSARTTRQNILSNFLLSAELRGEIAQPGYYFSDDTASRFADLDALMLTQGWRKYKYDQQIQDTFYFHNEPSPYVSGKVTGVFSRKEQKGIGLTLMSFGQFSSVDEQETDSLGRFHFPLGEEYVDSLNILIQSSNKAGKNRDYGITLDETKPPEIKYDHGQSIVRVDSVVANLVQQRQDRAQREFSYKLAAGEILLDEVVVERRVLSTQQQKVADRYGQSDIIIQGKAIQDKEEKWSYGLYSVLLFNFPDDIRIERVGDYGGYLRARILGGETTLVVVDGIPVMNYNYDIIPNIPPSEVKTVELIRFAKNFSALYREYDPQAHPLKIPPVGSVIAIYTHAGNGLHAVRKPTGLLQASVPVYSPIVEFYAPRYESASTEEGKRPDLRTLIHWVPNLSTDNQGKVLTSYYNADVNGEAVVVVEAISQDGAIGYQELVYEVRD